MKYPHGIFVLLLLLGGVASLYIFDFYVDTSSNSAIGKDRIADLLIQLWMAIFACISAVYVIHGYLITNHTFRESYKPQLFIAITGKAVTRSDNGQQDHQSVIIYHNYSNNQFRDLTIFLKITSGDSTVDLSGLFYPNMLLTPHDQRNRAFFTPDELNKRGFDITAASANGVQTYLDLSYSFLHEGKTHKINVRRYKWANAKDGWQIDHPD